ncbi:phospholipase D family protein [Defluviimonas sp. WL0024]|uniref:Phospholipase D n=1 Tax=Albidovulum salinarum TaxID=2984153 RepID=A0ABT2X517_9RHOB|nr:phospholipase D family protein [Defluviimonas sp. WL0024]MCU9849028.1 phospholipase D family protein [Defluviimonas sp. WL0024]
MMKLLRWTVFLVLVGAVAIILARLAFPLAPLDGRTESTARPASPATAFGAAVLSAAARHAGLSGVYPLSSGLDAYTARALMARAAAETIDAQYYIWADDMTGLTLLKELQDAADRGVRVRLLVDDNGTPALDPELAALDAHPNAEVRIFNPFTLRAPRLASYLFDFPRLNRRMHNKSFTVDGAATIIGGRNIGDVYFETGTAGIYFDLDVLAVGPAAAEVAADFDRYWHSRSSYPALSLIAPAPGSEGRLAARAAEAAASEQFAGYLRALTETTLARDLAAGTLALEWVPVRLFSDDPAKGLGPMNGDDLLISRLWRDMPPPQTSFDLVSAYFIPGREGTEALTRFADKGIKVRTLTNSLEATDVPVVHSGYVEYRDQLIDGGVETYELRSGIEERRTIDKLGMLGQSTSSLHAKSFAYDRRHIFIGSFNFDPRSARLNTEMGFLIDSPRLAGSMQDSFDTTVPLAAYRVTRNAGGKLTWHEALADGKGTDYRREPNTSWTIRALVAAVAWLPIEWML